MSEQVEVFVTKYALTQGVFSCKGHLSKAGGQSTKVYFREDKAGWGALHLAPQDFALTADEATSQVDKLIQAKLRSAQKVLDTVRKMIPADMVAAAKPAA